MLRDGFLGYQASFMLDFVVVALILIVPILLFSLYVVKQRRQYQRHRNLQLLLGGVLLVAVCAFEFDLHFIQGGWERVVGKQSPPLSAEHLATVRNVLRIHLLFAASTPILWAVTLVLALRGFPNPPRPSRHSRNHAILGWLSAADIAATSVTGLMFYYVAFVARG